MRARLRQIVASAALLLGLAGLSAEAATRAPSLEYQVKAAYLAKFAPFVQWPPAVLAPGRPVHVCVLGADPFGDALGALARQRMGDHPVAPHRLASVDDAGACHILYIRSSSTGSVSRALAAVRGSPILTVTDAADGDGAKGIIHFVVADNRVRFEVDAGAATNSRLAISSKLRSLALPSRSGG